MLPENWDLWVGKKWVMAEGTAACSNCLSATVVSGQKGVRSPRLTLQRS